MKTETNALWQRGLAWCLIAALAHPFGVANAQVPPNGVGDFTMYTLSGGNGVGSPNILLIIDTSDSMNIPEPWREYPGAYDSHIEYLWNDKALSTTDGPENLNYISTDPLAAAPFSPYGFWAGADHSERDMLRQAAQNYSLATEPGDPQKRYLWRNYDDASWFYWLPAGTAESDQRLNALSYNRFRGYQHNIGGRRGNIDFTATPDYSNKSKGYSDKNACARSVDPSSVDGILPSTVFHPSTAVRNGGRYLGDQWFRWDPWLNLDTVNVSGYPGSSTVVSGYAKGYLDASRDPPASWSPIPDDRPLRDSSSLPIRLQGRGSYAGWTDPKADMGGFEHSSFVANLDASNSTLLASIRSTYSLPATGGSERFSAWLGNRDNSPAPVFGMTTGTPAYFDVTASPSSACDPHNGPASAICINIPGGGVPWTTITKTRNCSYTFGQSETDAAGNTRLSNGTCSNPYITCQDTTWQNCANLPDPDNGWAATDPCLPALQDNTFINRDNRLCAWSGRSSVNVGACQWVGRQSTFIEGFGWSYYGGTCQEPSGLTTYCAAGGSTMTLFGATPTSNVTGPASTSADPAYLTTVGCSNSVPPGAFYYGGTCQGYVNDVGTSYGTAPILTGPSVASCYVSVTWPTLNLYGADYQNVVYGSAVLGCNDAADNDQTCSARYDGKLCDYHVSVAGVCPTQQVSKNVGGSPDQNRYYLVANKSDDRSNLVHDCKRDDLVANPAGGYMSADASAFATDFPITLSASNAVAYYTTDATHALPADATKKIDVYSVNYLNWKFGPKGPNGYPIGRKTRLQVAKDAITGLVASTNGVRFGLMVFNKTADLLNGRTNEGGNIAFTVKDMGAKDCSLATAACTSAEATAYANRASLINTINGLTAASRTPLTESLYEAYRYFRGELPVYGRLTTPAHVGGAVAAGCDKNAFATPGAGIDCLTSLGNYVSPLSTSISAACSKNYVIMMTDGGPEEDFSANAAIRALPGYDDGSTTITVEQPTDSRQFETAGLPFGPTDPADGGYVWLDELAYYMAHADWDPSTPTRQTVNTYTIGFASADSSVLINAANKGNGTYYVARDADALSAALTSAVAAILDSNPSLASPSAPSSALNRTESSREVYMAFFGPSGNKAWDGTVKKFRFGQGATDCGTNADASAIPLCLIGKSVLSGNSVKNINLTTTDPTTGETRVSINPHAMSLWSSIEDGPFANKGGTGQTLVDSATMDPSMRKVYTYITNPGASAEPVSDHVDLTHSSNAVKESSMLFDTLVTKARLGNASMTPAQQATLINAIRGGNTGSGACTDADSGTACATWRTWPHNDVLHGSPAIVTYDPTPTVDPESSAQIASKQYLYYFSNDGLLHAVNARDGKEAWSFLVEEALPQLQALNNNLAGQHLMLADGEPVVWLYDANGDGKVAGGLDKAYLYFGLRRGGRAYYAIDITDPDVPKFLWKIERREAGGMLCNPDCTAVTDFNELGYTWSAPVAVRIPAIAADGVPAVIFAGGYDGNQDSLPASAADTMGRAVYVVNGTTGALMKAFRNGATGAVGGGIISGMNFSIPSGVAALNTDLDSRGEVDRLYVGDMAANLWRFDINDSDPGTWTVKKLAALSNDFVLPATVPNRKIFSTPVVVKQNYQGQRYDAVYVGTGDREHPLVTTSTDTMFMVKDFDTGLSASTAATVSFPGSFYDIGAVLTESMLNVATFTTSTGWYLNLAPGEKALDRASVFSNVLRFSAFNPGAGVSACAQPGKGMVYAIDARFGGTLPSTAVLPATTAAQYLLVRQEQSYVIGTGGLGGLNGGGGKRGGPPNCAQSIVDGNLYSICDGIPTLIGAVGGAKKVYWYRQLAR